MTPTLSGVRGPRLRHVAHLVGTALSLSSTPIQVDAVGRAPSLVADSVYERRRAALLRQPVHLFVAGPSLLITVRPPSLATAADADAAATASANGSGSLVGTAHVWSDILSEMRAQPELLTQGAVQTNAVGLCAKLCAELVDFNFATYDLLKDWQRALKEAIEATTSMSSRSTAIRALVAAHLFDCESISQEMLFASAPMLGLLRSLAENDMDDDEDGEASDGDRGDERGGASMLTRSDKKWGRSVRSAAGSGGEPSSSATRRGSKLKRALSGSGLTSSLRGDRSAAMAAAADDDDDGAVAGALPAFSLAADSSGSVSAGLGSGSSAAHQPKSLLRRHLAPSFAFSASEHAASFDIAAGAQARLNMHLRTVVERCETLAERHTSAQTQMTNATLFRLSALQGITFPLTLLTGLYGMNFVHMPELQWKYSYFCFLGASALYIFFASRWYFRQLKALGLSTHD
jgi:hypothetical protein